MAKPVRKAVYWIGDPGKNCQLCERPFGKKMYDCRTRFGGMWANVCESCWHENGSPLGTGEGQGYTLQKDGRWLKTAG